MDLASTYQALGELMKSGEQLSFFQTFFYKFYQAFIAIENLYAGEFVFDLLCIFGIADAYRIWLKLLYLRQNIRQPAPATEPGCLESFLVIPDYLESLRAY